MDIRTLDLEQRKQDEETWAQKLKKDMLRMAFGEDFDTEAGDEEGPLVTGFTDEL